MVRISDNGYDWNKAKRLFLVNHTKETIHHHHLSQDMKMLIARVPKDLLEVLATTYSSKISYYH